MDHKLCEDLTSSRGSQPGPATSARTSILSRGSQVLLETTSATLVTQNAEPDQWTSRWGWRSSWSKLLDPALPKVGSLSVREVSFGAELNKGSLRRPSSLWGSLPCWSSSSGGAGVEASWRLGVTSKGMGSAACAGWTMVRESPADGP